MITGAVKSVLLASVYCSLFVAEQIAEKESVRRDRVAVCYEKLNEQEGREL